MGFQVSRGSAAAAAEGDMSARQKKKDVASFERTGNNPKHGQPIERSMKFKFLQ